LIVTAVSVILAGGKLANFLVSLTDKFAVEIGQLLSQICLESEIGKFEFFFGSRY